jgi:hypothetical protein
MDVGSLDPAPSASHESDRTELVHPEGVERV